MLLPLTELLAMGGLPGLDLERGDACGWQNLLLAQRSHWGVSCGLADFGSTAIPVQVRVVAAVLSGGHSNGLFLVWLSRILSELRDYRRVDNRSC